MESLHCSTASGELLSKPNRTCKWRLKLRAEYDLGMKLILLYNKDALNQSKVTVKCCIMFLKLYFKSFERSVHQRIMFTKENILIFHNLFFKSNKFTLNLKLNSTLKCSILNMVSSSYCVLLQTDLSKQVFSPNRATAVEFDCQLQILVLIGDGQVKHFAPLDLPLWWLHHLRLPLQ